ncbi:MAG: TatD family hydrolase [Bacteroidaceae bacterium]|nr:TatD family hydrolase [Bacteroidaceae bacterium]
MFFVDIHTHNVPAADYIVAVVDGLPVGEMKAGCYSCVGLHPWKIGKDWAAGKEVMRNVVCNTNVQMVGECGIDRVVLKGKSDAGKLLDCQIEAFRWQAEIAEELRKPMILHCVKGVDEILKVRSELKPLQKWILHGFRGGVVQASQLMDKGIELSFGLHHDTEAVRMAFSEGKLWIETDDSGCDVRDIYGKIAEELGVSVNLLAEEVHSRFCRLLEL